MSGRLALPHDTISTMDLIITNHEFIRILAMIKIINTISHPTESNTQLSATTNIITVSRRSVSSLNISKILRVADVNGQITILTYTQKTDNDITIAPSLRLSALAATTVTARNRRRRMKYEE